MYEDDLHCLYLRPASIAILRGAMSFVCKALAACIRVKSKEPCQAGQYWSVSNNLVAMIYNSTIVLIQPC